MDLLLRSAAGYWHPLVLVAGLCIALIIALLVRSRGNRQYSKTTEQVLPFFSGNKAPEENVGMDNLYWGFFAAMGNYYGKMKRIHNGVINDYVYWFLLLAVVLLVAFAFGGAA